MAVAVCSAPLFVFPDAPITTATATPSPAHPPPPHPAPIELIKIIFDLAARSSPQTALTLTRVCHTARQWALPILYESVDMDNARALSFQRGAAQLKKPTQPRTESHTPSPPFQHIRNLRATCLPDPSTLSQTCPNLHSLSIANYDVRHLPRLVAPALKRLTITGSMRYCDVASHASGSGSGSESESGSDHNETSQPRAVLHNVTHLRFADDVPRLGEELPARMAHLTHFSCLYTPGSKKRGAAGRRRGTAQSQPQPDTRNNDAEGGKAPSLSLGELDLDRCITAVLKAPKVKRVVVRVRGDAKELARVREVVACRERENVWDGKDGNTSVDVVGADGDEMDVWGDEHQV